jgi:hypothetical protein
MTQPYNLQRERVYSEVEAFTKNIKFAAETVDNTQFDSLFPQGNNNSDSEQDSE